MSHQKIRNSLVQAVFNAGLAIVYFTLLSLTPDARVGADEISFHADFPGAKMGIVEKTSETSFRMEAPVQADEKNLNWQRTWFAFRLDGLPDDKNVLITFHTFDSCYNGRKTQPRWVETCPVFSMDRRRWTNFTSEQSVWDDQKRTLTIEITPSMRDSGGSSLFVAYTAMYVWDDLKRLESDVQKSPFVRIETVGQSLQQRPLIMFTISDFSIEESRKKRFVILAREHAWEAHTSWQADGMIRFLVSDTEEAVKIRKTAVVYAFPIVDIDGAENGQIRFNGNGYDVNRRWNEADLDSEDSRRIRPEVWYVKKKMVDLDKQRRIVSFVNLHNDTHTDYIDAAGSENRDWPAFREFDRLMRLSDSYDPNESKPIKLIPNAEAEVHSTFDLWWDNQIPGIMIEQKVCKNRKLNREPTLEDSRQRGILIIKNLISSFLP